MVVKKGEKSWRGWKISILSMKYRFFAIFAPKRFLKWNFFKSDGAILFIEHYTRIMPFYSYIFSKRIFLWNLKSCMTYPKNFSEEYHASLILLFWFFRKKLMGEFIFNFIGFNSEELFVEPSNFCMWLKNSQRAFF